jgi:hypothetical protein
LALTFRQRRQLAALWRQLATEDPGLAGGLSGTARPGRRPAGDTVGWWMLWTGICLLPIGVILAVGHLVALAVVLLTTFWMPMQGDRLDGM